MELSKFSQDRRKNFGNFFLNDFEFNFSATSDGKGVFVFWGEWKEAPWLRKTEANMSSSKKMRYNWRMLTFVNISRQDKSEKISNMKISYIWTFELIFHQKFRMGNNLPHF